MILCRTAENEHVVSVERLEGDGEDGDVAVEDDGAVDDTAADDGGPADV